jgi:hypothetical protein
MFEFRTVSLKLHESSSFFELLALQVTRLRCQQHGTHKPGRSTSSAGGAARRRRRRHIVPPSRSRTAPTSIKSGQSTRMKDREGGTVGLHSSRLPNEGTCLVRRGFRNARTHTTSARPDVTRTGRASSSCALGGWGAVTDSFGFDPTYLKEGGPRLGQEQFLLASTCKKELVVDGAAIRLAISLPACLPFALLVIGSSPLPVPDAVTDDGPCGRGT